MKRVAKFEKVSLEQFMEGWTDAFGTQRPGVIEQIYDGICLPKRATAGSAGYDFFAPAAIILKPGETVKIPTGIRVWMEPEWVLKCYPRSGLGFKYRLQLNNTVGIIDSDYYGSDNEGHIFFKVTMDAKTDSSFSPAMTVEQGSAFVQGIFLPYGVTTDDDTDGVRNGGFGSTDMSTSNKEVVYNASGDSGIRS